MSLSAIETTCTLTQRVQLPPVFVEKYETARPFYNPLQARRFIRVKAFTSLQIRSPLHGLLRKPGDRRIPPPPTRPHSVCVHNHAHQQQDPAVQ